MTKFCKNCGAYIDEATSFCPDCGKSIPQPELYCPNCKSQVKDGKFCPDCGTQLKKSQKKSLIDKYQTPIIIICLIAAIAGITAIGVTEFYSDTYDVDTLSFTIPEDYVLDPDSEIDEDYNKTHISSKAWYSDYDYIQIDVSHSEDSNENETLKEIKGKSTVMMDHEGKYTKDDTFHEFSFVEDDRLCTVTVTDKNVFDEIEILS